MERKISNSRPNVYDINPVKNSLLELLNKTIKGVPLNQKEFDYIIKVIEVYPNILEEINFNSEKFYELILKNDVLATEIILKITNTSTILQDYLALFFDKEFSVNLLKTLNKLIQKIEFPDSFIKLCLLHIIKEIKNETLLNQKKRMMTLFCFFILNLLDHEHITIDIIPPSINEILKEDYKIPECLQLKERIIPFKN